jgi:thioredoxin
MDRFINLTSKEYDNVIKEDISLVYFWAPWCRPCRMIVPILEELVDEFEAEVTIYKVNTDEEEEIALKNEIRSIPTMNIYKNGQKVETIEGKVSKEKITNKIKNYLV